MARRDGSDDGALHDINDDNLPPHSGLDDGPLHDANDDNLPRHSGLDDGPLHDVNDDHRGSRGADDILRGGDTRWSFSIQSRSSLFIMFLFPTVKR